MLSLSHIRLDNKLGRANLVDEDLMMLDQHFTDRNNPWLLAVLEELQQGRNEVARLEGRLSRFDGDEHDKPEVKF